MNGQLLYSVGLYDTTFANKKPYIHKPSGGSHILTADLASAI